MYLFQRIRLYLDFAVMTPCKAVNIIPLKYVLFRQVKYLQVQKNQHSLIADMFILIKPTLLFIDMCIHLFNIQEFNFLILVNFSSLLILYIKPWYKEKPCIREKGTQIIIQSSIITFTQEFRNRYHGWKRCGPYILYT